MTSAVRFKASQFNIVHGISGTKFKIVNTLWRSFIQTEDKRIAEILTPQVGHSFEVPEYTTGTVAGQLIKCGMLVPAETNEFESFKTQFKHWTRNEDALSLTFAPTFRCNFACVYCVQEPNFEPENQVVDLTSAVTLASCTNADSHNAKVERASAPNGKKVLPIFKENDDTRHRNRIPKISPLVIKDIVRWADEAVIERSYKTIAVTLFGGEPLLEYQYVVMFMQALNEVGRRRDMPVRYQMVSNGFLATRERLSQLKELGLSEVQITIDGLRNNHNKRRSMGQETYDRIWQNVVHACELGIKVLLLTVIDNENIDDLIPHIDYAALLCASNPALAKNLELQFGELFETNFTLMRTQSVMLSHAGEVISKRFAAYEYAKSRNVSTNNPFLINSCARESEDSVLIGPQGDIYKCYSTIGDKRHQVGSVFEHPRTVFNGRAREVAQVRPFMVHKDCQQCDIVPYCRSGCQFVASLYNDGKYGGILCEYDSLKAGIVQMMERDVL